MSSSIEHYNIAKTKIVNIIIKLVVATDAY
jgi:hypothetical protein